MNQAARLREIVAILSASHHPVHRDTLLEALDASLATFKRDIGILRDQMHAPIKFVGPAGAARGGYILEDKSWSSGKHGLPNAWFSASELYAILMIDELASHIGAGLLSEHLRDLVPRITMALSAGGDSAETIRSRIKILKSASRRKPSAFFDSIAQATVKQEKIEIDYFTRNRYQSSIRTVSPQRLVHYKENWYLIAWCHKSDDLRMFSVDSIQNVHRLNFSARKVAKKDIDAMLGAGFGIYSGQSVSWAELRFSAAQAPWVSAEEWHPDQEGSYCEDGSYQLRIPFSNPKELILEILKYGENVEVISPASLRSAVRERLQKAARLYADIDRRE